MSTNSLYLLTEARKNKRTALLTFVRALLTHLSWVFKCSDNDCLYTGIPELGVPVIEPLVIHKLSMENGNGAVRVRASFYNVTIVGGSNYTITSVK